MFTRGIASPALLALTLICSINPGLSGAEPDSQVPAKTLPGRGRTVIEAIEPWKPSDEITPKVIYGADDRIDVYQETDDRRQSWAASTCALFSAFRVTDNGNGTYNLSTFNWTVSGRPPCADEPFRTQPVAAFCSGWLAGEDLIVTAGHCLDSSQLNSTTIVFGFDMANASSPVTTVDAGQVYFPMEIVARELDSITQADYTVIRVDRPVTAPGARPLPIRRTGEVLAETAVGVIGHPAGLPKKIAFGDNTRVNQIGNPVFFTANLDTYGGNSGSPVFNAQTGVVEGILVRGAEDYVVNGNCFNSNVIGDDSVGEDCTRTSLLAEFIPELDGITFDKSVYACGDVIEIRIRDSSSTPGLPLAAGLTTSQGDMETVALADGAISSVWIGSMPIENGAAVPFDGILQVQNIGTITASYLDPDGMNGQPLNRTALTEFDCIEPVIVSGPEVEISSARFTVEVGTDEPTRVTLEAGVDCDFTLSAQTASATAHRVTLSGLEPCTIYNWRFTAIDEAGNETHYGFETDCGRGIATLAETGIFEDGFDPAAEEEWTHSAATGVDQWAVESSANARSAPNVYGFSPGAATFGDASLYTTVSLTGMEHLEFWHTFDTEAGFDGAVIEADPGDGNWIDLGAGIVEGGYTGEVSAQYGSAIGGRMAWTGGGFGAMTRVVVDLSSFTQTTGLRFRFVSDESVASNGWEIDGVRVVATAECMELPPIHIVSPNGGETLQGDGFYFLSALSSLSRAGTLLRYELHNSQGYIDTVGTGYDPSGMILTPLYMPLLPEASDYRIRAFSVMDPTLDDFSDAPFTVSGGAVRVYRPLRGERWDANRLVDIHWQMNPFFGGASVRLELWSDRFGHVADLGTDFDFDGEALFRLLAPEVASAEDYRIRASSVFDPSLVAFSDTFEIVNPNIPKDTAVRNFTLYE